MKKILFLILTILIYVSHINASNNIVYPFIYIPGMFDNGDGLTEESGIVKTLNSTDGYYFKNYFNVNYNYNNDIFFCSSNIVGKKYERLIVANLIGDYRTNISLNLMSDRLFCFLQGIAPDKKNYKKLTAHKGNDYSGKIIRNGVEILYNGVIEETWAKYGKKVFYKNENGKNNITFLISRLDNYYINEDGYFKSPDDIKFNIVAHSSGGLAIRKYIAICQKEGFQNHINYIINLSVPQKGARLLLNLNKGFPKLIKNAIDSFYQKENSDFIEIVSEGKTIKYTYKELINITNVKLMYGDGGSKDFLRNMIGFYISYFIPFDGKKDVLGTDPALHDLNPKSVFVKSLSKEKIPSDINVINYVVSNPYSVFFKNIGDSLNLGLSDGAVDVLDTMLDNLPGYNDLQIKNIQVDRANHIPMPYIKALFELKDTLRKNYYPLNIVVKKNTNKEEKLLILEALFKAILKETGFELEKFMKTENYSVIDYFADNPVSLTER